MSVSDISEARPLRHEPVLGAAAQIGLLHLLGAVAGLGPVGWLAGLVFTAATWAVLAWALYRSWPGCKPFGPANVVTLTRLTLAGGVTALVAELFVSRPPVVLLVALTAVALVLDAVDGQVARRTGSASAFGARFDMEADAFLILVLSIGVALSMGPWVLAIGAMRYVFVAAARVLPWLNGPLPPSMARKTVAAVQGVVLLVAAAGVLPDAVAYAAVMTALALLVWSFARDIRWLWHVRVPSAAAVAREPAHGSV